MCKFATLILKQVDIYWKKIEMFTISADRKKYFSDSAVDRNDLIRWDMKEKHWGLPIKYEIQPAALV